MNWYIVSICGIDLMKFISFSFSGLLFTRAQKVFLNTLRALFPTKTNLIIVGFINTASKITPDIRSDSKLFINSNS